MKILKPLSGIIVALMGLVLIQAARAADRESKEKDLSGIWDGDAVNKEWGVVNLKKVEDGYIGTYTDTWNGDLGNLSFQRVGERKYQGLFWETSLERYGALELEASEDGQTITLSWKTLDEGKVGPNRNLVKSTWKR